MTTVIAIANQKGGVGKTTTTHNLGVELARRGRTVTLVDIDPQSSLTFTLGINAADCSVAQVLGDHRPGAMTIAQVIRPVNGTGKLWLVPSDIELASMVVGLERRPKREEILKRALAVVTGDYVLVDCPPSLGLLTLNALTAADLVLIPCQTEFLAMRGLTFFWKTLRNVRELELNAGIRVLGILPTMYRCRTTQHRQVLETLQATLRVPVFDPVPQSVRTSDAQTLGRAVREVEPGNAVAAAYTKLAREVDRV